MRIDDRPCGPASARKYTRSLPRRLLLDEGRVAKIFDTGKPLTETVDHASQSWRVELRPLLAPKSRVVIGVQAAVAAGDQRLPEPPPAGCWEWQIARDAKGQPTLDRRSYWDRTLFDLYQVDPGTPQRQSYWEVGDWANRLVDQADQMRVNSCIRDALKGRWVDLSELTARVHGLTFNAVTGYGSDEPGRRHLRALAMLGSFGANDEYYTLLGFSYAVEEDYHELSLVYDTEGARVDDVLRGVMELAGEPMAVVDSETLDVLMTSSSWRRAEFGHVGGLREVVCDASGDLQLFISEAAQDPELQSRSMRVRLRRPDGQIQAAQLTATGVESRMNRDAVVRLDLLDPESHGTADDDPQALASG